MIGAGIKDARRSAAATLRRVIGKVPARAWQEMNCLPGRSSVSVGSPCARDCCYRPQVNRDPGARPGGSTEFPCVHVTSLKRFHAGEEVRLPGLRPAEKFRRLFTHHPPEHTNTINCLILKAGGDDFLVIKSERNGFAHCSCASGARRATWLAGCAKLPPRQTFHITAGRRRALPPAGSCAPWWLTREMVFQQCRKS